MDDNAAFLESAASLLSLEGLEIVGRARTSDEALELARSTDPDLALVDVELGQDDGVELAQALIAQALVPHVILISMRDRAEVEQPSATSGIAGFIRKDRLDADAVADLLGTPNIDRARAPLRAAPPAPRSVDATDQLRALRRVAAAIAQGADPSDVFRSVAREASRMLGIEAVGVYRYDPDKRTLTKLYATHGDRAAAADGATWSIDISPHLAQMFETGEPERDDYWLRSDSIIGERHRAQGFGESIAAPIMVDGDMWGCLSAFGPADEELRPGCEYDLADFAGMIAAAIANVQARGLAESQAALRRVATLVAEGAEPQAVFTAVAQEASALLRVDAVSLIRYDPPTRMLTKIYGTHGNRSPISDGTTWPLSESPECELVVRTGAPSRVDDWTDIPGPVADRHRAERFGGSIGAPITVAGALWGVLAAYGEDDQILPAACESDLADFTRLMASAIANADARDELRRLAERQGEALRRVSTLVAQRSPSQVVFDSVAAEARKALAVARVEVCRRGTDGSTITFVGSTEPAMDGTAGQPPEVAERVAQSVIAGGGAIRIDGVAGHDSLSAAGAPIRVEDEIWGVIVVLDEAALAEDIDARLVDFTHLVASSISNVNARDALIASRARIVTSSDDTRRRIERNLHDGVQQRVVSLALKLRGLRVRFAALPEVETTLDDVGRDLDGIQEEIRTFSQGLHPVLLSRSGLGPALRDLVRRCSMIVDLQVDATRRCPPAVESAVYYVVSEALSNAGKHAQATAVSVQVCVSDAAVSARIVDDGVGGASLEAGSGLIGLIDRVEAAGGHLVLSSPREEGTTIAIEIPLRRGVGE